ncbi:hypothetical protein ACFFRR_007849 [Megaselia abdita]
MNLNEVEHEEIDRRYPDFREAFENCDFDYLLKMLKNKSDLRGLKTSSEMESSLEKANKKPLMKSDKMSTLIRNNGNKLLRKVNPSEPSSYLPILLRYETALCFAVSDECKYKAYGNIAKIYQNVNFHEHGLAASQYALQHAEASHADRKFEQKIIKRITDCHFGIISRSEPKPESKISSKMFISKSLKLCDISGIKSVVSTAVLKPGDIIAHTKPFAFISCKELRRQTCNHCGNRTSAITVPCDNCVHASFCSEICKSFAMSEKGFHTLECHLFSDNFLLKEEYIHMALKFTVKALKITNKQSFENDDQYNIFDWEDKDGDHNLYHDSSPYVLSNLCNHENDEKILKSILSMKKMELGFEEMLKVTLRFNEILEKLRRFKAFKNFIGKLENGEKSFSEMFFKVYPITRFNMFVADSKFNIDGFYGNLTHSCKPNLMVFQDSSGINSYVVFEDIKVGEKLTVALRDVFYEVHTKLERERLFNGFFGFKCDCYACRENLPTDQNEEQLQRIISKFYAAMGEREEEGEFKELIEEFVKPCEMYEGRITLFQKLFYIQLHHCDVHALFAESSENIEKIERGLL